MESQPPVPHSPPAISDLIIQWILWVLASLGGVAVSVLALPAFGFLLRPLALLIEPLYLFYAVFGAIIGIMQWLVLRRHVSPWWIAATAGGFAASPFLKVTGGSEFAVAGTLAGLLQGAVLFPDSRVAIAWIIANVGGWILSLRSTASLGYLEIPNVAGSVLVHTRTFLIPIGVTGFVVALLPLRSAPPHPASAEAGGEFRPAVDQGVGHLEALSTKLAQFSFVPAAILATVMLSGRSIDFVAELWGLGAVVSVLAIGSGIWAAIAGRRKGARLYRKAGLILGTVALVLYALTFAVFLFVGSRL